MANQITLTFSNVTNNGQPCTNPIIVILGANDEQILFPCGDKVDANGQIKISVPEELFSTACINGFIKCSECGHCEEKEFEACLCETAADCKECEKCEGGVCVKICPDKICHENTCVDCVTPGDCPPGFICVGGECVCNGKINEAGECVDCLTPADCSSCEECRDGGCIPLVCPNNLICIGNGCGCPPGFVYEAATNSCVPEDECSEYADCPECEICVGGRCQPIECPEGYKCVGGVCIYSPCDGKPCANGLDCPNEDCGCPDETKVCTSCIENPDARGCEPNGCGDTPCSNNECQEGCGCHKGQCIPCSWLTPEEQAVTPGCDGDGQCNDIFDSKIVGCNLETTLTTVEPCACPVISGALTNGANSPTVYYQNPGSNVSTTTQSKSSYISSIVAKSTYKYQLRKGIATNYSGFVLLPKLDDVSNPNIAHNEMPNNGTFTLEIYGTYRTETAIGVLGSPTTVLLSTSAASVVNKTEVEFSNITFKTVELATAPTTGSSVRGLYKFLTDIKYVVKYDNLAFPNTCQYGSKTVFEKTYVASTNLVDTNTISQVFNTDISVGKIQTSGNRLPMFVYKRSKTSNFTETDVFRKVYVPKTNGVYKDVLYGPGCVDDKGKFPLVSPEFGFYSGYNYLISNNCGCDGAKQKLVTNAIVCETLSPSVTLSACNTELTILPITPNCAVNKNLADLLGACSYPADAQVYFKLYVNGTFEGNLTPEVTTFTKTFDTGITNVKITHSHDESCVIFEQDYESAQKEPAYTIDCKSGNYADIVLTQVVSPGVTINKVTNLANFNEYVPLSGVVRVVNVLKGSTVTLKIEYSDGCTQKLNVIVNCCGAIVLSAVTNNGGKVCNSVPVTVTLSTANAYGTLTYYMDDVLLPTVSGGATFTATEPGIYVAKVVDQNGCERTLDVTIGACTDITISLDPELICTGDNSTLRIEGDPGATVILQYPSLASSTVTLDVNGRWEQAVSTDGVYEILSYNGVLMTGVTAELNVVSTPTLTSISGPSSACEDTAMNFTFIGTANANITVNFGFGSPVNLVIGGGGTVTHSVTYSNPGSYTVQVTSISVAGACSSTPGLSHAITIVQKPTITIGDTVCDLIAGTSSTAVTVSPTSASLSVTSGVGSITGTLGNFFVASDTSETLVLTATNGSCSTVAKLIVNCNCPAILVPEEDNIHGVICASYSVVSGEYSYSITTQPTVVTNYNGSFTATLTYKGTDYSIPSNASSAWVNVLPVDYEMGDPDLFITIVDDATGCEDVVTLTPTINATPIVSITGPTTLCVNKSNTFTSNSVGSTLGYDYLWTVLEDGLPFAVTGNTSANFSFTPTSNGSYYDIMLTRTHTSGCSTNSNIIMREAVPCCTTLNIGLTTGVGNGCNDLVLNVTSGTAPFTWDYAPHPTLGGGLTANGSGVVGSSVTIDTDVEFNNAQGVYRINVVDNNGCTGTIDVSYHRCKCTCNGTSCVEALVKAWVGGPATYDFGIIKSEIDVLLTPNEQANNFRIKRNGVIVLDTTLIGNQYSLGCTGTEPMVNLDNFAVGDDVSLTANGIIAKGGVVNSTYITMTEKAAPAPPGRIAVRINETSGSGAHYILYLDEAGSLGSCNTNAAGIVVTCPV